MPRAPLPEDGCYPPQGDVPHPLREHYPSFKAPTSSCAPPPSSRGLRRYPYNRESLQVATSPCCIVVVPDVISASLSLDAWSSIPVGLLVHVPGSSQSTAAFPERMRTGRLPTIPRPTTSRQEGTFAMKGHSSMCSGLQVCLPPRSLPPQQLTPLGGHGVYVRAECMLIPSCTSDMLAV